MRARPDRGSAAAILLAIAAIAWFAAAARFLLLFYPPVWPDEGLFVDAAWSLASRGTLANPILSGILPGIASHNYWVPPAYLVYLAGWLRVLGSDVAVMRLASFVLGIAALALVVGIARRRQGAGGPAWTGAALAAAVLATHPAFLRASLMARMDLLTMFCGLGAVWIGCEGLRARSTSRLAFATALATLALATHPLGLVPLAIVLLTAAIAPARRRAIAVSLSIVVAALLLWLLYGARDWPAFVAQLGAQMHRKSVAGGLPHRAAVLWRWLGPDLAVRIVTAIVMMAGAAALILDTRRDRTTLPLCALVVLAYPASAVVGGEAWYTIYMLPVAALGVAAIATLRRPGIALGLAAATMIVGIASEWRLIEQSRQYDYRAWAAAVERLVDAQGSGSTVMLNSVPDPWPALIGGKRDVTVIHAPPEGIAPETLDAAVARASLVISSDDIINLGVAYRVASSPDWRTEPVTVVGGYKLLTWTRVGRR